MKRLRYSIGVKLVLIITSLVLISLGSITTLVSWFSSQETQVTAEENNRTVNMQAASSTENELSTIRANVFLLLDMLDAAGTSGSLARQASVLFFERNQNTAAVAVKNLDTNNNDRLMINNRFFVSNELDAALVPGFLDNQAEILQRAGQGEVFILNASPFFSYPLLAMIYPWKESGRNQVAVMLFSSEPLSAIFSAGGAYNTFLINHDNDVLVHGDFALVKAGANYSQLPLVTQMRGSNSPNMQIMFTDSDGVAYFGAYNKLNVADAAVLTTVSAAKIFEPVYKTLYRNIYLTAAVLFLAVLFIWFFSKTISTPVKALAEASNEIEQGNFLVTLKARTHDEIGLLTERFVKMGKGLAERERLKDTFGRFINKEIAERAMKGELALGGETKQVTIFFSDIRSFTAISEKLEPFEVVEFLNDYMTRMVDCVNNTHGVVDKFIGDAVMAVWGAPVSAGKPADDALNCVRAALMMRQALIEFNRDRGGDKKPIIKIGCGINTGSVVAGQIGSTSRMEYTVIGDAVNLASRTEALNKPFGSDILVTENTYELVKDFIVAEEMPPVTVKGKEKPVRIFAVVSMAAAAGEAGTDEPQTLSDVRRLLNIPTPDFARVNTDEEEQKYKIQA